MFVVSSKTCSRTVNPRRHKLKRITRRHKRGGGGGGLVGHLPSTFNIIHPIDLIFGTYNKLSLYFQLIESTWYLIGIHSNHSHINDVIVAAILDFKFSDFFIFELNTENGEKTILTYKIVRSIVKLSVFLHIFSENLNFCSQHTSCVTYYNDVINRDVT